MDIARIPANQQILVLKSKWKFIPNKLLAPTEFPEDAPNIQVPGQWESNVSYGTYQIIYKSIH